MAIRNVVFDVGGVLLEWNPPRVIERLHPDPKTQALIRQQMFEHSDWHEFDRGTLSYADAIAHFASATGLSTDETRALIHATRESLTPIEGTIRAERFRVTLPPPTSSIRLRQAEPVDTDSQSDFT